MKKTILLIVLAMSFLLSYAYDCSQSKSINGQVPTYPYSVDDTYQIPSGYTNVFISVEATIQTPAIGATQAVAYGEAYDYYNNLIGSSITAVRYNAVGITTNSGTRYNVFKVKLYAFVYAYNPGGVAGARAGLNWI